jgi:hypothetical protein
MTMKAFARRGFQLRTAAIETRLAYTCFLLLMLPGIATLVALSIGRMGFSPVAIAAHYRGGESEMSFPKTIWQLVEVSHFHLFTIPIVVLILSHLLYGTPASARLRIWLTSMTFWGAFLDAVGPWAVRYVAAGFSYVLILGWIFLAVGAFLIVLLTLFAMWGPQRAMTTTTAPPATNGEDRT